MVPERERRLAEKRVKLPLLGQPITRRGFFKAASLGAAGLYLTQLGCRGGSDAIERVIGQEHPYGDWTDLYRQQWTWDNVTWGTHLIDCYPGSCLFHVYTKDGIVWREEQAGTYPEIEPGVPDLNPRGCQKGACFSDVMYAPERLRHPIRRVGERGSGRWERISWDEALGAVADGILDAQQEVGPESVIYDTGPGNGGIVNGPLPGWRLSRLIGATVLDTNGMIGDFNVGLYETFGKFHFVSSVDDWFHADLILVWHMNPVFTRIPSAHFIYEARYHGTQVVNIAPDYNASSVHADLWVPVEPGSDAALALAMCRVIVDEGWVNEEFVREQTDLPLLVRLDTKRYLRETDLSPDGEARDDQLYVWDESAAAPAAAPRDTLRQKARPALRGQFDVTLADGTAVQVTPVFELLRERLRDYTPERAAAITGVTASLIRRLARMVAEAKRVHILQGWNVNKYYHGDLMERSQALLLALTGNFGRKGTGMRGFNTGQLQVGTVVKERLGIEGFINLSERALNVEEELLEADPTLTEEMRAIGVEQAEAERRVLLPRPAGPLTVPAAFYWYWHAGYDEVWDGNPQWSDPAMKKSLGAYLEEAVANGWWEGVALPPPDRPPRVLFQVGASTLRRTRGGYKTLLRKLWPKLKLIVAVDLRMSSTAYQADIVLPAAGSYEKTDFRFPTAHVNFLTFTEQAVRPVGEAKPEWEIFTLLARKIEQRARARGISTVTDAAGHEYRLDELAERFTMHGALREHDGEVLAEDIVRDTVRVGALPERTTLSTFRKKGVVRFTGIGATAEGLNLATDIKRDETVSPLRWHVERKMPYPTLSRRIQFYIDHDWFLDGDEALPRHKPNPQMGGSFPLKMLSGHLRWSIHSTWVANRLMLRTHRGQPFLMIGPKDAEARGVADGDEVRVFNDFDDFHVPVKVSAAIRPGQVTIYHAWEPYQYKGWKPYDTVIPGMIKWLHLAGGYGHLRYWRNNWQPQQADRAIAVEVEKSAPEEAV